MTDRKMRIAAVVRCDDEDRMFAEITDVDTGLLADVLGDNGNMHQSMRDQVRAWAAANGHEVMSVEVCL